MRERSLYLALFHCIKIHVVEERLWGLFYIQILDFGLLVQQFASLFFMRYCVYTISFCQRPNLYVTLLFYKVKTQHMGQTLPAMLIIF